MNACQETQAQIIPRKPRSTQQAQKLSHRKAPCLRYDLAKTGGYSTPAVEQKTHGIQKDSTPPLIYSIYSD
ncbi:hypothetical protein C4577_02695 [Candidatus Parcubacteria bacterium]|nr:MAG: hypothetical protein C4577_02695 [Candidatus Parcubacteria bacterium]